MLNWGLCLRRATKGVQDADHQGIGSEDSEADRGNHGKAENERHEKRNQFRPPFFKSALTSNQP